MMQVAFEVMGVIAVITNCWLVSLLPSVQQYTRGYTDVQVVMLFVAAEVCVYYQYSSAQRPNLHMASSEQ